MHHRPEEGLPALMTALSIWRVFIPDIGVIMFPWHYMLHRHYMWYDSRIYTQDNAV